MTNKTQCPNCLTIYVITDEQYQKSKGKVRCGTCRQPFYATFLADDQAPSSNADDAPTRKEQTPKTEVNQTSETSWAPIRRSREKSSESVTDSAAPKAKKSTPPTSDSTFDSEVGLEDNLNSELSIDISENSEAMDSTSNLIDKVDSLIDEKLADPESSFADVETADDDDLFTLNTKPERSALSRWLFTPLAVLGSLVLVLLLLWQLWMRQSLPWLDQLLDQYNVVQRVEPHVAPLRRELEDRYGLELPERRDLPGLRLVSARVEPHPVRPSTTLLKVSLVNRSTIAQPFPWLELALSDVDGRLVSRRTLSPADYLHNNRLANVIRSNELRPVTIELLAFPRQAHGYELKIIER